VHAVLPNCTAFPPEALESVICVAGVDIEPFSASILAEKPEAKLEYIRYPPTEAKTTAKTTKLALLKYDAFTKPSLWAL
jgi:hypothetical protein